MQSNRTVTYGKISHQASPCAAVRFAQHQEPARQYRLLYHSPLLSNLGVQLLSACMMADLIRSTTEYLKHRYHPMHKQQGCTVSQHQACDALQEDGYSKPVGELNKIKPDIKRDQPIPTRIDAYSLHILPGVDSVFMLAVAVALDEAIFGTSQIYGSQFGYGGMPYGGMGYGGMGYGGMGYGGLGYGGLGMGGPMLLGGGLGLGAGMLMGGFW